MSLHFSDATGLELVWVMPRSYASTFFPFFFSLGYPLLERSMET